VVAHIDDDQTKLKHVHKTFRMKWAYWISQAQEWG